MAGALVIDNTKISLFPDFSAELQKQRVKFINVKRCLRSLELQYAMLYMAQLQFVAKREAHFFDKPSMAAQWLDREERSLRALQKRRRAPTLLHQLYGCSLQHSVTAQYYPQYKQNLFSLLLSPLVLFLLPYLLHRSSAAWTSHPTVEPPLLPFMWTDCFFVMLSGSPVGPRLVFLFC